VSHSAHTMQAGPGTAAAGLRAQLESGAGHLAVHALPGEEDPIPTLAALAPALGLSGR
jgi:hypothetical protein